MPKLITKNQRKIFDDAFANLATLTKSNRNKAKLSDDQIQVIKDHRLLGLTPKQLEELTGMSVYRIHQIINSDPHWASLPKKPKLPITFTKTLPDGSTQVVEGTSDDLVVNDTNSHLKKELVETMYHSAKEKSYSDMINDAYAASENHEVNVVSSDDSGNDADTELVEKTPTW